MKLESGPVRLRPLREDDLQHTLAWRNRDDVRVWFKHSDRLTMQQHQAWFEQYKNKFGDHVFIAEADDERVGQVAIYGIDFARDEAEVGRFIAAPGHSGKGYMRHAIEALAGLAFERLRLRRIWLEVMKTNDRAIHVYDRCGFIPIRFVGDFVVMERCK